MADSTKTSLRVLNPWVLHVQKLGLELKCPLCLSLFTRPLLLPCDHIFCNSCIPRSPQFGSECPVCKSECSEADLRPLHFVENLVTIFKGLDAFSGANLSHCPSVAGRVLDQCPPQEDNSSGQSVSANKLGQVTYVRQIASSNGQGPVSSQPSTQIQGEGIQECGAGKTDMNCVEQTLLGSPPSFDDIKGSDNESSDQGSEHSPETYAANRPIKKSFDGRKTLEHGFSASEVEDHLRDSKRQKKLNYSCEDMCVKSAGNIQSMVLSSERMVASNPVLEPKSGVPVVGATLPKISDSSHALKFICGFCKTSKVSEATGSMLHYANGKQVMGDDAACSNVIHVHSKCIDWAPQVYYDGEMVKNLKAELARGAQLKCNACGKKGAALGCYMKSCRRSYHFPCALEIPKCRWDNEDFLLLCPMHSSVKFPNEKSRNCVVRKDPVPLQVTPQQCNFWSASPYKAKKWVLCGSALSTDEKILLVRFGSKFGVTVSKVWRPDATHVIAATDEKGACMRTLKVLMAIANGCWVLKIDWIKACMEAMRPVYEEPYEVSLDNHGCQDGPRTGRLRVLEKASKLFDGLSFFFSGDFIPAFKEDLQSLVIGAGGLVWKSEIELLAQERNDKGSHSKILIVYNLDSPHGSQLGEEVSIIWKRLNEAQELANKVDSQVIGHTWLLESIAAHKLQPLVS
ncbi:BRCA1-associated RING domain protein 1 [Mangifera indica]|uniref:BRCA1-associated RING domain protein 1 n=1 Tax=Mangifera indica TaxID=29780 RepID=UPI001CF9FA18|nr:BRCA1-associated RING domain protein 1 [Mangifera indica]